MRRDDPLVDAALRKLSEAGPILPLPGGRKGHVSTGRQADPSIPDDETLAREAMRVLGRLTENGALLAVADGLDKAVVVRDLPGNGTARTAIVDRAVAQAMALKDWIAPTGGGRITRYRITGAGRTALASLMEKFGTQMDLRTGCFGDQPEADTDAVFDEVPTSGRARYGSGESPLSALARRRTKNGEPFLDDSLVQAGEQLREDFELAQMDARGQVDWDAMLEDNTPAAPIALRHGSEPSAARDRVRAAIQSLGPGLADVALRCCCYLEGLEVTERRLGWSARSGKIVLRIALMALKRHYEEALGKDGVLIG